MSRTGELFPLFKCFEGEVSIKRAADQEFTQARDISLVDAWSTCNFIDKKRPPKEAINMRMSGYVLWVCERERERAIAFRKWKHDMR